MMFAGFLWAWAAYAVGSYGWVLLRGWDIPVRQWMSPLHPYTWPPGGADPPPIPDTQLFPGSASPATTGALPSDAGVVGAATSLGNAFGKPKTRRVPADTSKFPLIGP